MDPSFPDNGQAANPCAALIPDKGFARSFPRRRKPVVFDNRILLPTRSHLSQNHFFFADSTNRPISRVVRRRRHSQATRSCWAADTAEGRDLASSNTPLPSDHDRISIHRPLLRQPSLVRQEAFCHSSTCKPSRMTFSTSTPMLSYFSPSSELAALCSTLNLNNLSHDQPFYSLRPAKRRRKLAFEPSYEMVKPLELNLSFADLRRDDAIARFLITPSPSELANPSRAASSGDSQRAGPGISPLRIIYELVGASKRSTHPPPPSLQPIRGSAIELLSDLENDSADDDLVQHARAMSLLDSDLDLDGTGWAVVGPDPDADFDPSHDVTVCTTPGHAAGAWIFVGDDSSI